LAYIACGTNLSFGVLSGPALLQAALAALADQGAATIAISRFWRTKAWPDPNDPPYTNAVACVYAAAFVPQGLLAVLQQLEEAFGRMRTTPNAPRTMDLDLLDFDGLVLATERLILPHPRLHERTFVLGPLCDIAPDWRHPTIGRTASQLWDALGQGAC
jgi:2-amino-4-hydroxy-6-hydroxymethyldihydropteridine diphosphokinase